LLIGVSQHLLGLGVQSDFYKACRSDEVRNGSLNRFIVLEQKGRTRQKPSSEELPPGLIADLKKLKGLKKQRLPWDKASEELFEAYVEEIESIEDDLQRELILRAPEQMVRIATILACCRFSKSVELSDMEIGQRIMKLSANTFQAGIDDAQQYQLMDHQDFVQELERHFQIKFGGQASRSQIERTFRHNKKNKFAIKDALDDMVQSGTLTKGWKETGGRDKQVYKLVGWSGRKG
jgi:hypothetical protein